MNEINDVSHFRRKARQFFMCYISELPQPSYLITNPAVQLSGSLSVDDHEASDLLLIIISLNLAELLADLFKREGATVLGALVAIVVSFF